MNEEKLQQIQDEIMNDLDKESKTEENILRSADQISANLMSSNNKKAKAEINGIPYTFAYKVLGQNKKKKLFMLIANEIKQKITPEKYLPFTLTADLDDKYTMEENMKASIEGFIRHVTGTFKPEVLE